MLLRFCGTDGNNLIMKKQILLGATAVATCFAIWLTIKLASPPDGQVVASQSNSQSNAASPPQTKYIQAKGPSNPAINSSEAKRSLLDQYNKARNLRVFLYDFLRNPEKGGLPYAFAALTECKHAAEVVGNANGHSEESRRAAIQLAARCDMSDSERDDVTRQLAAVRALELTNDPDLKLVFDLSQAKTLGDKSVAVAAIIQNGDPFVMRSILLPQATGSSSDDGQSRVYFQNQWYQGSQGIEQIDMAYDLAMCQMGVDCGSDSNTALVMCSEKGWCGGSVQDAIQQQLNAEGAGKFGEVSQIASQILSQIKSGNASAFVHL